MTHQVTVTVIHQCKKCNDEGVKITNDTIHKINGFPNNIWGWGMEDIALQNRANLKDVVIHKNIIDDSKDKDKYFKVFNDVNDRLIGKDWQQAQFWEVNQLNRMPKGVKESRLQKDGINNITYKVLSKEMLTSNVQKLLVDIGGEGSFKSKIQIYADKLGVKVKFLGSVPNNEIAETYNSYAVYVLCSFYEGNPKTLLEAMACGCAVIGTDVPGIRSIISHKKNGLLIDNRPSSLKESILNILSDNKLRDTLTVNAIEYIKNNNSLEDAKTKEFNTYTECLK